MPIDLGPDSSPYQINQYPTVGNLCSPRHVDSADAQLIISGISSGVAVTEITGYNTIPLAAPITGTESIEILGDLILDATPPNLDPYATSLGNPEQVSQPLVRVQALKVFSHRRLRVRLRPYLFKLTLMDKVLLRLTWVEQFPTHQNKGQYIREKETLILLQ